LPLNPVLNTRLARCSCMKKIF